MRGVPSPIVRLSSLSAVALWTQPIFPVTLGILMFVLIGCASGDHSLGVPTSADSQPPIIRILQPAVGARVEGDTLMVDVEYADQGSGIAVNSFLVRINEQEYTGSFDQHSRGASGRIRLTQPLPLGEIRLVIQIADRAGNVGRSERSLLNPGRGAITISSMVRPDGEMTVVALSPNGMNLAVGRADGTVRLWDLASGTTRDHGVLSAHARPVSALAFSPDNTRLASGSRDGTVRIWNVNTPETKEQGLFRGHRMKVVSLAFAPGGRVLASGSWDQSVRLWEIGSDEIKPSTVLDMQRRVPTSLAFAPEGKVLAIGGNDGAIVLRSLGTNLGEQTVLARHSRQILSIGFPREGGRLVSTGADKTVCVWELGRKPALRFVMDSLRETSGQVALLTDGLTVVSVATDGRLLTWNLASAERVAEAVLPGLPNIFARAANGTYVAIAYSSGVAYVLRLNSPGLDDH